MSEYRVFISHKSEDHSSAVAVREALGQFSGDLEFFISGDNIPPGEDWRDRLRSELRESDLLLLLFTEPTRNWDWCLYECGLFTSLDGPAKPVVCMYHSDGEPPSPLVAQQGVPARIEDVADFVTQLITTTDITRRERPINANLTRDQIERAAADICDEFGANIQPYYACYRVRLDLPADVGECEVIPAEASLTGSEGTMRIFGRLAGTRTWGELVAEHAAVGARWLDEINRMFRDSCAGRVSPPTTHTFRAHDGGRIFRPELYRLDKKGGTPVAAVIIFTEEVAPSKVGGPVFNRLRIAERYKTEVFDRLDAAGPAPPSDLIAELTESFDLIREEAKTQNVFEEETLRTSFPDAGRQDELRAVGEEWDREMESLAAARQAGSVEAVLASLQALDDLNDRYRGIVAQRYTELLNPPE